MAFEFELRWSHQLKRMFVVLNLLGIAASLTGFVIGLIQFNKDKYLTWNTASFIGGSVASVTMFYVIYFSTALIALRWNNVSIITIYMIFTYSSIVIRIVTLILYWLYDVSAKSDWLPYVFLSIELILAFMAHTIRRILIEDAPFHSTPSSIESNQVNAVPIAVERRNSLEEREKRYTKK